MDNHCSWFENCVGYFNVRYFYLYMAYMVAGLAFVIIVGLDLWYHILWISETSGLTHEHDRYLIEHSVGMGESGVLVPVQAIAEYDSENSPREHDLPTPVVTEAQIITANLWKIKAIVCIAITCFSVLFAFGILIVMHGKNIISRGITSRDIPITTPRCTTFYNQISWYRTG